MTALSARRDGFALPTAMIALVLLSALVAGALFIATEELRSGRSDVADQRALAVAEWALERAMLGWDTQRNTGQPRGARTVVSREAGPNDTVTVVATRAGRRSVWMTAVATSRAAAQRLPARHTVGASLRLISANIPRRAALTTHGAVAVEQGVIDGRDALPSDSANGLCDPYELAAGISVADTQRVRCVGCSAPAGIFGAPAIDTTALTDSSLARFGTDLLATLPGRASIELAGGSLTTRPVVTDGVCDRSSALNWGDPTGASACADWFPIIHVRGDVALTAGSVGQGILIVEGALRFDAGARFVGSVIVSDDITVDGPGAEIVGVALAGDADRAGESRVANGGAIRFSSCAVRRSVLGSARLARTPVRWWVELR